MENRRRPLSEAEHEHDLRPQKSPTVVNKETHGCTLIMQSIRPIETHELHEIPHTVTNSVTDKDIEIDPI